MNKEEVSIKITTPLFEKAELDLLDNYNETMHDLIEEYTKMYLEDKEKVIVQRIIICQQEEIERLNNIIKRADDLLELKQMRYLNENNYRLNTISLQEVRNILKEIRENKK